MADLSQWGQRPNLFNNLTGNHVAAAGDTATDKAEATARALQSHRPELRPARHRIDRGGFGTAINHCLKPHFGPQCL